jgi:hypothetical protein
MSAKVLALPGSPYIPQSDLEILIRLDNEIRQCREIRDALALDVIERSLRGTPVEPGIYYASVTESQCGGVREVSVYVE